MPNVPDESSEKKIFWNQGKNSKETKMEEAES
jgi:hypothetical protein